MDSYENIISILGSGLGILAIILVIALLVYVVFYMIAIWKLFKKAGKKGWESIVPVYSYLVFAEIAGLEWWWGLLAVVDSIISLLGIESLESIASLVSMFAVLNIFYNVALRFNKNKGTAVCAGIFSGIFALIFGLSKNEVYNANIPVSKHGIFGKPENTVNNTNNAYNQNSTIQPQAPTNNYNGYPQNNVVQPQPQPQQPQAQTPVYANNVNQEFAFCKSCGAKMDKNTRFCPTCGKENI